MSFGAGRRAKGRMTALGFDSGEDDIHGLLYMICSNNFHPSTSTTYFLAPNSERNALFSGVP